MDGDADALRGVGMLCLAGCHRLDVIDEIIADIVEHRVHALALILWVQRLIHWT